MERVVTHVAAVAHGKQHLTRGLQGGAVGGVDLDWMEVSDPLRAALADATA